jgi:hypothetical protein
MSPHVSQVFETRLDRHCGSAFAAPEPRHAFEQYRAVDARAGFTEKGDAQCSQTLEITAAIIV